MALALKEIHPSTHATERQLVRAVRHGDDYAFEQLFSRYRRRISAYVYGLLNDHGRAEDITQEVFISALRRLRETDGPISFKPWIYEIARNACIDEFRRLSRANLVSLDADVAYEGATPELADHTTPEVRFQRKQQMGDLFGAFSGLSNNHHKILVLRELEGLSYGEIGERMGMSRPMVESTLFRARRRLTQEYNELATGRRCLEVQAAVDRPDPRGLLTLGIRERRRIARHLNHCQDCGRYARLAGVDQQAFEVPAPARRVAALLPFGWIPTTWGAGKVRLHGGAAARTAQHASALGEGTPQGVAVGRAAAAAAALLITGGTFGTAGAHHRSASAASPAAAVSAPSWSPTNALNALAQVPVLVTPRAMPARVPAAKSHSATRARHVAHARGKHAAIGRSARATARARHSGARRGTHSSAGPGGGSPSAPPPHAPAASPGGGGTQGPNVVPLPVQHPLAPVTSTLNSVGSTTNAATSSAGSTLNNTLNTVGNTLNSTLSNTLSTATGGESSTPSANSASTPGSEVQVPSLLPTH